MKQIPLYGRNGIGKFALVDDEDYDYLMRWRWYGVFYNTSSNFYVVCNYNLGAGKWTNRKMHHFIVGKKEGLIVDHIDGDGLNNQRSNLRFCTKSENSFNKRKYKNGSSKYVGVTVNGNKWIARIQFKGKLVNLGSFPYTEEGEVQAHNAYQEAANKYFGEFKRQNPTRLLFEKKEKSIKSKQVPDGIELPEGSKALPLTKGKYVIINESDYEWLSKFSWHLSGDNGFHTAKTNRPRKTHGNKRGISMHTMIMNPPEGYFVDHINNNPLDNRRCNLRLALPHQNSANTRKHKNKKNSQYKGVFKVTDKIYNKSYWVSKIKLKGKTINIGCFPGTPEGEKEAAIAYNKAALLYNGAFANQSSLNNPNV